MARSRKLDEGAWSRPRDDGFGPPGAGDSPEANVEPAWGGGVRARWLSVAGIAMLVVAWFISNLVLERAGLVVLDPQTHYSIVAAGRLDKLLGVLVLFLLAADRERLRLRWVAMGFLILGLGPYAVNLLSSLLDGANGLNARMYEKTSVWTVAYALFAVGLFPRRPPRFSWWTALAVLTTFGVLMTATVAAVDSLPLLNTATKHDRAADLFGGAPLPELTRWHFALSVIPLGLAVTAAVGAACRRGGALGGWLLAAMVLLAGAQLHDLFWPLPSGPVLTSTRVLHFAFAATVVVGGIVELRRIAAERSRLLAVEREHSERMRELAVLKADFTAMVAHELGTPLAAIQGYTDMLATGKVPPDHQARILERVETETDTLNILVADVRAAATVEREDFAVQLRPVALEGLLEDAAATVKALDGAHTLDMKVTTEKRVWADAERIGQVLRNLLLNAVKYSPEGTLIEVRATETYPGKPGAGRVRIEVADRGPGIHPDDLNRIFEKFGRGSDAGSKRVPGAGLGLYLSQRIVRAHGGELTVDTAPGRGSIFAFELEAVCDPRPAR